MRTADSIEEVKAQKDSDKSPRTSAKGRGSHPNSRKNLVAPWQPGVSGNPGGKPKFDVGAQIARAVLEQNAPEAYKALAKALLKGNAYVFKELCERGFGKLKETHQVEHVYEEVKDGDLAERVATLERDLGLAQEIDDAGRIGIAQAGAGKANGEAKDSDVLSR